MDRDLQGVTALVTAGATRERIDPVRFISNDSSGKQGYAIATALAARGAKVTLISGITSLSVPAHVTFISVESAHDMLTACVSALPVTIAVCCAAVADFRPKFIAQQKIKKIPGQETMQLELVRNPDILHTLATHPSRPQLVIGFAAESENLTANAQEKLRHKGCDWIIANDITQGIFGSDDTEVQCITRNNVESWGKMSKMDVAEKLTGLIAANIANSRL